MKIVTLKPESVGLTQGEPFTYLPFMKAVEGVGGVVRTVNSFESADGRLTAGPALFDKMTLEIDEYPVDEFMYILEGTVEVTDRNGQVDKFGPGDAFVMPKGFSGTWRQLSAVKKYAVSYTPGGIAAP